LETSLFLYLNAVAEKRLTLDDIILRMENNPRRIFKLPTQADTWIEIDPETTWEINAADEFTRCGWTPFEGWKVKGRLKRVILRGETVYLDGKITAKPGSGRNVRLMKVAD
jgi:carbamoyl-phosphate synthase/aspartate carbamoyltransferase/dihydroorotase